MSNPTDPWATQELPQEMAAATAEAASPVALQPSTTSAEPPRKPRGKARKVVPPKRLGRLRVMRVPSVGMPLALVGQDAQVLLARYLLNNPHTHRRRPPLLHRRPRRTRRSPPVSASWRSTSDRQCIPDVKGCAHHHS